MVSFGNLALQRFDDFLLLGTYEFTFGEIFLEFFQLNLHYAILLQLLLVFFSQSLVMLYLSLQVSHAFQLSIETNFLAMQTIFFLRESIE